MSQTPETPETPTLTAADIRKALDEARQERLEEGRRSGPVYTGPESHPLVWYDQVFERGITPSGSLTCEKALRVGHTTNRLDVLLVASHKNESNLTAAASATVTLTLLQGEKEDETFAAVGPTICVEAPTGGISAEPDGLFARFAIGNFTKPWLKIKLEFSGTISGGTCDCALSYMPG